MPLFESMRSFGSIFRRSEAKKILPPQVETKEEREEKEKNTMEVLINNFHRMLGLFNRFYGGKKISSEQFFPTNPLGEKGKFDQTNVFRELTFTLQTLERWRDSNRYSGFTSQAAECSKELLTMTGILLGNE